MLLPDALEHFFRIVGGYLKKIGSHPVRFAYIAVAVLVLFQFIELFTVSKLFSSDSDLKAAAYLNDHFQSGSIAVFNAPVVSDFLVNQNSYLILDLTGMPPVGQNPLFLKVLPDAVVSYPGQKFLAAGQAVLMKNYAKVGTIEGYQIYKRIR
ncbi:hypothetical protein KGQ31_00955, partial [Patescibacteria group bacterium]|nr:hypothetical protein [Patescibacteria group bacterium]